MEINGILAKNNVRVHLLDKNMDLIFEKEPLQCYLGAYLFNTDLSSRKEVEVSKKKAPVKLMYPI